MIQNFMNTLKWFCCSKLHAIYASSFSFMGIIQNLMDKIWLFGINIGSFFRFRYFPLKFFFYFDILCSSDCQEIFDYKNRIFLPFFSIVLKTLDRKSTFLLLHYRMTTFLCLPIFPTMLKEALYRYIYKDGKKV